eukprot:269650-Pleurochrysis_carterae.AAC.1
MYPLDPRRACAFWRSLSKSPLSTIDSSSCSDTLARSRNLSSRRCSTTWSPPKMSRAACDAHTGESEEVRAS